MMTSHWGCNRSSMGLSNMSRAYPGTAGFEHTGVPSHKIAFNGSPAQRTPLPLSARATGSV